MTVSKKDNPTDLNFERLETLEEQLNAGEITEEAFREEYMELMQNLEANIDRKKSVHNLDFEGTENTELEIESLLERLDHEEPESESVFLEDMPTEECDPKAMLLNEISELTLEDDLTDLIEQLSTVELSYVEADQNNTDASAFDAEGTTSTHHHKVSTFDLLLQKSPDFINEEEWKGLHPASLAINLLPQTLRTIKNIWPLLLVLVVSGNNSGTAIIDLTVISTLFALGAIKTIAHYLTLRYRLYNGRLELKEGFLFKKSRTLDPKRIQNIELARNPIHRLFGMVELRIETAGDTTSHGLLSALNVDEASRLQRRLESISKLSKPLPNDNRPARRLIHNNLIEIILYGLSSQTVGTLVVLAAVGSELLAFLHPSDAREVAGLLTYQVLIGLFLLGFAASWIWSAGKAVLRHSGFELHIQNRKLSTTEGLLTKRTVQIPQSKVQLIEVSETLMRRLMGYGTFYVETAALGMADGELRKAEGIAPMVEREQFSTLLSAAAPQVDIDPWVEKLKPAHPRALYRNALRRIIKMAFICGLLIWTMRYNDMAWWLLLLIPATIPLAYLDWRWQGWAVTDKAIVSRRGVLMRETWILDRDKIQSVHVIQTPFMRLHQIGQVLIRVAGNQIALPDIALEDAKGVLQDIRNKLQIESKTA